MSQEQWKQVVGYEGIYEVSDQGKVRRVKSAQGTQVGRILRPRPNHAGYFRVVLYRNGKGKNLFIHRLVLTALVGKPAPGQEGNHKKGDKTDNRAEKLEWVTKSENHKYMYKVLKSRSQKGIANNGAKLTNKDIPLIKRLLERGKLSQQAIGEMFGVGQQTISYIKTGRAWAHI